VVNFNVNILPFELNNVLCIKINYMKKAYTIYLEPETYEKLKAFADKKGWSLTRSMEHILKKIIKPDIKKEIKSIAGIAYEKGNS